MCDWARTVRAVTRWFDLAGKDGGERPGVVGRRGTRGLVRIMYSTDIRPSDGGWFGVWSKLQQAHHCLSWRWFLDRLKSG